MDAGIVDRARMSESIPIQLRCDNQAAIAIASPTGSAAHTRCKHIAVRHHFLRELVAKGELLVRWVRTEEQLADVMTKGLDTQEFTRLQQHIMGEQPHKNT